MRRNKWTVATLHRKPGDPAPADPLEERFLAFGRVFSGVLRQVCAELWCCPRSVYPKATLSCSVEHCAGRESRMYGALVQQEPRTRCRPRTLHHSRQALSCKPGNEPDETCACSGAT